MPALLLQHLLGDLPVETFLAEHWLQAPLARKGAAGAHRVRATWAVVDRLVETPAVDLLLVRDGKAYAGARPGSAAEARALFAQGYSLALRQPDRQDAGLAELGRGLVADLCGALNLHVYGTPAGHGSFGWHYDPEEVFILQTEGTKRYQLRQNTVNPTPLLETMGGPHELARETTRTHEVVLEPGDLLYIPGGWWHATHAETDALSISVGLLPPTGAAALDFLRAQLLREPRWQARMGRLGRAVPEPDAQRLARLQGELQALGEEVARRMADPAFALRFFAAMTVKGMGGR